MTKAKTTETMGFACFKVRVVVGHALIHVVSSTEPIVHRAPTGEIASVDWNLIVDTEHGDTVGFLRWADVNAITWRPSSTM
jgi:hypothetical protein